MEIKMVKKSLLVVSLLATSATVAMAESNATTKKDANKTVAKVVKKDTKADAVAQAKELFKQMNLSNVYKYAVDNATNRLVSVNPAFKPIKSKIKAFYQKNIGWNNISDDIAKLYAKHYTVDELKKLTEFYKTPLGQKTLKVSPTLAMEGQKLTQKRLTSHLKELKAMLDKAVKDAQAKSKKSEHKKGDKKAEHKKSDKKEESKK